VPCRTDTIPLIEDREREVEAIIEAHPMLGLPLTDAPGYRRADVVQACINEGACTPADVIDRRLRLHLHLDRVPDTTLAEVEAVMATGLIWR
jgi:glycerol-3-phosphate dehydrogenase